jgi:ribonuclease D
LQVEAVQTQLLSLGARSWQVNLVGQAISEALLEKEAVPAPVEEEVPVSTE